MLALGNVLALGDDVPGSQVTPADKCSGWV
jgi:hypothetical protein